jgi:hypothetical protein
MKKSDATGNEKIPTQYSNWLFTSQNCVEETPQKMALPVSGAVVPAPPPLVLIGRKTGNVALAEA